MLSALPADFSFRSAAAYRIARKGSHPRRACVWTWQYIIYSVVKCWNSTKVVEYISIQGIVYNGVETQALLATKYAGGVAVSQPVTWRQAEVRVKYAGGATKPFYATIRLHQLVLFSEICSTGCKNEKLFSEKLRKTFL